MAVPAPSTACRSGLPGGYGLRYSHAVGHEFSSATRFSFRPSGLENRVRRVSLVPVAKREERYAHTARNRRAKTVAEYATVAVIAPMPISCRVGS